MEVTQLQESADIFLGDFSKKLEPALLLRFIF